MASFKSSKSNFSEMKLLKEIIQGENNKPNKLASKDISETLGAVLAKQLITLPKTDRSTQTNWKWRVMAERWRGAKLIAPKEKPQEPAGVKKSQVVFKLEKAGTEAMSDGGDEPRITESSPSQLRIAKSRDDLWFRKKAIRDKRIELTGLRLAREYDKIVDTSDLIFDPVDPNIQQVLIGKAATQRTRRKTLSHSGSDKSRQSTGAGVETSDHALARRTSTREGMEASPVTSRRSSISRAKSIRKESLVSLGADGSGSGKSDRSGGKQKSMSEERSKKKPDTEASSYSSGKSDKKGQLGTSQKGDKKGGFDKLDEGRLSDHSEKSERLSKKSDKKQNSDKSEKSDKKRLSDHSKKSDKRRQRDEMSDNKRASDVSDGSDKRRLSEFSDRSDKKSFSDTSDRRVSKDT